MYTHGGDLEGVWRTHKRNMLLEAIRRIILTSSEPAVLPLLSHCMERGSRVQFTHIDRETIYQHRAGACGKSAGNETPIPGPSPVHGWREDSF